MGFRDRVADRQQAVAQSVDAGTPVGQARAARERGDLLLHLGIPTAQARTELAGVAAEGWTLVSMAAAWLPTQNVEYLNGIDKVGGQMMGYYAFTRA